MTLNSENKQSNSEVYKSSEIKFVDQFEVIDAFKHSN